MPPFLDDREQGMSGEVPREENTELAA